MRRRRIIIFLVLRILTEKTKGECRNNKINNEYSSVGIYYVNDVCVYVGGTTKSL